MQTRYGIPDFNGFCEPPFRFVVGNQLFLLLLTVLLQFTRIILIEVEGVQVLMSNAQNLKHDLSDRNSFLRSDSIVANSKRCFGWKRLSIMEEPCAFP